MKVVPTIDKEHSLIVTRLRKTLKNGDLTKE